MEHVSSLVRVWTWQVSTGRRNSAATSVGVERVFQASEVGPADVASTTDAHLADEPEMPRAHSKPPTMLVSISFILCMREADKWHWLLE